MKFLTRSLQNPFVKILISPLASIIFGLIIGASQTEKIQWLTMLLLYLIVISSQLLDHFLYLQLDRKTPEVAPNLILYFFEAILIISSVIFMLNSHWIINLLLAFYIIFIHIQYMPFKMTGTIYHYLLSVFFNGFILNVIAYYSQTFAVTQTFLINLIPIVLIFMAMSYDVFNLKNIIINGDTLTIFKRIPTLSIILSALALALAFYLSIPSTSFYIVQVLFVLVSGFTILPLLVNTRVERQAQNKINYVHAIAVIFTLLYSMSQLY